MISHRYGIRGQKAPEWDVDEWFNLPEGKEKLCNPIERFFRLEVEISGRGTVAELEGTFINRPFDTRLIGQFLRTNKKQAFNFSIVKRQHGTMTFDYARGEQLDFEVEICAGRVSNRLGLVDLASE